MSHADEANGWFGMFICRHSNPSFRSVSCIFPMTDAFLSSALYCIIYVKCAVSTDKSGVQGTESLAGARGVLASSFFLQAGLRLTRRIMSGCQNIRKSIPDWEK